MADFDKDLEVYFPFGFVNEMELSGVPADGKISGYAARIEKTSHHHALKVTGLPERIDPSSFVQKLCAGLYWAAVEKGWGIWLQQKPQDITFFPNPIEAGRNLARSFGQDPDKSEPCDALISGDAPAIYPVNSRIRTLSGGRVTEHTSTPSAGLLSAWQEGASTLNASAIVECKTLTTALDLYSHSRFQNAEVARFLVLCIVLETIAPDLPKSSAVVSQVNEWIADVKAKVDALPKDSNDREEFESLPSRLGMFKRASHSQRIKQFIRALFVADGRPDGEQSAAEFRELYSMRGNVMHEGQMSIQDGGTRLDALVRKILMSAMRQPHVLG